MVVQAKAEGVRTVRIHALLDGRDVPETSALDYVVPFEAFLAEVSADGFDARIASGGGRQLITMDRYDANWPMVEKGWNTHVLGQGPQFPNATAAVNGLREQNPGTIDQDLPEFVIAEHGEPIGSIEDGDSVVFFNFRGDRAIEITGAFEEDGISQIRSGVRVRRSSMPAPGVYRRPSCQGVFSSRRRRLPIPPANGSSKTGITQFACSETQKFGHVTYFWTATAPANSPARPTRKCRAMSCPTNSVRG